MLRIRPARCRPSALSLRKDRAMKRLLLLGAALLTLTTLLPDDAFAQRGGFRGGGFRGAGFGGFRGAAIGSGFRGGIGGFRGAAIGSGFRGAVIGSGFRGGLYTGGAMRVAGWRPGWGRWGSGAWGWRG